MSIEDGQLTADQTLVAQTGRAILSETAAGQAQLQAALDALDDLKAEEIVAIDLAGKTSIADWMVVATGRSSTQVGALADKVVKALKEAGASTPAVEGLPACDWVLIDAGDLIVHLFRPEVRAFYNLEKMWGVDRPGAQNA